MKTIYADFNSVDEEGCIRLNCNQTLNDIENQGIQLKPGLKIKLSDDELISSSDKDYYSCYQILEEVAKCNTKQEALDYVNCRTYSKMGFTILEVYVNE